MSEITWEQLTETERRELADIGAGRIMFFETFHKLKAKGLVWFDYTSNREIVTPAGRELLNQRNEETTK